MPSGATRLAPGQLPDVTFATGCYHSERQSSIRNSDILANMRLSSPAFDDWSTIPEQYGQNFANINPPLLIVDVPMGAASLVLFMDDPDIPALAGIPVWDHWVVFNIPVTTTSIPEAWTPTGVRGKGTRGFLDYSGPRPPDREHRYFFRLYALDVMLDLPEGSTKHEVADAMHGHILASAELIGRFAPS